MSDKTATAPMAEYRSRDAFEIDNPHRYGSMEADYGVHWRDGHRYWSRWRVSYLQVTGEVYAIEERHPFRVRVLGVVPPDAEPQTRSWEASFYRTLDRILAGWAELPEAQMDLAWVAARLRAAGS